MCVNKTVYSVLIDEHIQWLRTFGQQRIKKWEDLLNSNDEAAICEALVRKMLSGEGVNIEPCEDLSSGGLDFLCQKLDKKFYTEVTCITKETATKKTKLSAEPEINGLSIWYKPPTEQILEELRKKAPKCANLDSPCLLAICTLYFGAGFICFRDRIIAESVLTGTPHFSWSIDTGSGKVLKEPHQSTELKDSGFIRPQRNKLYSIEEARKTISAVLLVDCWSIPVNTVGVLHPNPNYPFDRTLLPSVKFARLSDGWQNGSLKIEWI